VIGREDLGVFFGAIVVAAHDVVAVHDDLAVLGIAVAS